MRFFFGIGIWWWNANAYYAGSLAKNLADNGHEVIVAARKNGKPYIESEKLGLNTVDINFDTQNPFILIASLYKLHRAIKQFTPDYVVPATSKAQFLMTWVKILFDRSIKLIRILADVQSPKANLTNPWFYKKWLNRIIASSEVCKNRVKQITNYPSQKIETIYLGYNIEDFYKKYDINKIKAKYQIPDKIPVILNIGRLAREKDQITLVESLPLIEESVGDYRVIISGEEQFYTIEHLRKKAEALDVSDKIVFFERVSDVRELLALGNIGVITSIESEVVCRIATEYMIYKIPIIGTDVNVIPEMIEDDINGYIVPVSDPESLARNLSKLLSSGELREFIGSNNLNKARSDYSNKSFYEKFLNFCMAVK